MLIKSKDSPDKIITELESLVVDQGYSVLEKEKICKEIAKIKAGHRNEDQSAYLINLDFGGRNQDWAVIHDLKISCNDGTTAQIDHLIINRQLKFYVIESKSFFNGIKISENGEFSRYEFNHYVNFESPIEQNRRHIVIFKKFVEENNLMPSVCGLKMTPTFESYVVVNSSAQIIRPKNGFDTKAVIKADQLTTSIESSISNIGFLKKLSLSLISVSSNELKEIAQRIAGFHEQSENALLVKHKKRLTNISTEGEHVLAEIVNNFKQNDKKDDDVSSGCVCDRCNKPISDKTVEFCKGRHRYYENKNYCVSCQKKISTEKKSGGN